MAELTRNSSGGTSKIWGHLGALFVVICWGVSFLSTKVLMGEGGFSPIEVFVYRFTLAYLVLLAFTFRKIKSDSWADELRFVVCGICSGAIYFITENYALRYTSTGNVSLLSAVSPIFTTLLMAVVFRQAIKMGTAFGSLIAFAGVACVVFSHGGSLEFSPKGDLLALSSALSWAIYSIVVKKIMPRYDSLYITRKMFFYGTIVAVPLLFIQQQPLHLGELFSLQEPKYLLNMLFLALMCSLAAFILFNQAMRILGAVTANNYIYAQPLVTMIAAYLVFHEEITLLGYIGCALIIGGLILADKWTADFRKRKLNKLQDPEL
ncbi:MAG: DMT family transporter [Muribaculaceae bacterium]|nr:DMT family transporter [Muribaculaceae bacterium]